MTNHAPRQSHLRSPDPEWRLPYQEAAERYGEIKFTGDAIAMVPQVIEVNKKMLSLDDALMTVAILMRGNRMIHTYGLDFYDQASKRIAFHKLADWVQRHGADGVVVISESWVSFLGKDEDLMDPNIVPARDRPDKMEAINVIGMTSDGRTAKAMCIFTRGADDQIKFGDTVHSGSVFFNSLEPVRRLWAKKEAEQ